MNTIWFPLYEKFLLHIIIYIDQASHFILHHRILKLPGATSECLLNLRQISLNKPTKKKVVERSRFCAASSYSAARSTCGGLIDLPHTDLRHLNLFIRATFESRCRVECSLSRPPCRPSSRDNHHLIPLASLRSCVSSLPRATPQQELDAPREIACTQ